MAVPEQTPYSEHTGNGVTKSFALGFICESKDHLIVLVDEIEPPIATWSLDRSNVVFTTAPASGQKITIQRNTPFSRTTDYQSYNNSFRPQTVNGDFDRIWLKLQELGVASWLLKNYVDRKDDELKAYLMEEIRKQGVALDQLDDYYNYLMQRLAQIAVDKGWDASFVVDGTQTQKQINADNISVKQFGAKGNGTASDVSAINNAQAQAGQLNFTNGTYLIDSDLTITVPFSFSKKANIKLSGGAKVYFAAGTCDEVCARWFSGNRAIQDAINSAKYIKNVVLTPKVWDVYEPVVFPTDAAYWGVTLQGVSNSIEYENLGSARNVTIRAMAQMECVVGNRTDWKATSGYFNKLSNLNINGNNLAKYGYINGYQDIVSGVNVNYCTVAGFLYGGLSNSTEMNNISATRNQNALILTGGAAEPINTSTHALIQNFRFRQNFNAGVIICQATGVKFLNGVIEANETVGIQFKYNNTTDDFASPYPYTDSISFERVGMEGNAKLMTLNGTGAVSSVYNIEFKLCNIVGKTTDPLNPVSDITLNTIRGLVFDRCNLLKVGVEMQTGATAVSAVGYETVSTMFPTVFGVNASSYKTLKIKDSGDEVFSGIRYGAYAAENKTYNTTSTIDKVDVFGTVLTNSGQAAQDIVLTLPTGLVSNPRYSPSFTYIFATQQLANKVSFKTQAGSYFVFNGAQRTTIESTNGTVFGAAIKFTLFLHQGTQYWLVEPIQGTWTSS